MSEKMTKHNWTGEPQDSDSKSDLKALRAAAEKATPGEWVQEEHSNAIVNNYEDSLAVAEEVYMSEDRYFIATFNPARVLALLDRLETAEQALERVRELHSKTETEVLSYDCSTENCEHEDGCPAETKAEICGHCYEMCEKAYTYFGEEGIDAVIWPCPTIQVLEGEE